MKHIINGFIYKDNASTSLKFIQGSVLVVQGNGFGSYKIQGKLGNGNPKLLALVNASTLEVSTTATNDNIYKIDVTGLSQIEAIEVSGVSEIYADIS